jgi:diphosphomevalonate decarboxylase
MITARAHANIALVKYWGKRNLEFNVPATGSLSLTLDALTTTTSVRFGDDIESDSLQLNGAPAPENAQQRVSAWLDVVRDRADIPHRAAVFSENNFPTASGLASSASAYASLSVAASRAAGLELTPRELSVLARRGSGSAARSIFGGFVFMHAGADDEGNDSYAWPLETVDDWGVRMVIAIVGGGAVKDMSSTDAMYHCAETSPLYKAWLDCVPGDLDRARSAIATRDLDLLGDVMEDSATAMHAAAIASRPAVIFWQPATLRCMARVRELRDDGAVAYFTMDAGAHVKVLTHADDAEKVATAMRGVDGVTEVLVSEPGGPAVVE